MFNLAFCEVLLVWLFCYSNVFNFLLGVKPDFIISITSNSGDSNVLVSKNKEYIKTVINAINEAIIYRG